ncbi:MAG: phosphotransferase [Gordonia sp. (in: high G+C Gram-positive bacteria)]
MLNDSVGEGAASAALTSFHDVRRGDPAPDWVRSGIVDGWSLPADTVVTLIVLSENVTFVARPTGAPPLIIRLARPGYSAGRAHLNSELTWIEALRRDAGIPTPGPVRGADGQYVQTIRDASGGGWDAVAFEFVAGSVLEDQAEIAGHFAEIGSMIARLHAHSRTWRTPSGFERFAWTVDDMVGKTARWGDWRNAPLAENDRSVLERAELGARAALVEAGASVGDPRWWGLIHADLRPSNVMVSAEGMTIIDFDDCGYGFYLYDFAAALTFYEHRPEAGEMAGRWLDGYRTSSPLSSVDLVAAAALSMLRRLTMLGWQMTHRPDALPADLWDENQDGTVEVAARYLSDPLWLVR